MILYDTFHNDDRDMKLHFYGEEDCIPGHSYGPGSRKVYLIHYVLSGKGVFKTSGKAYNLERGQGFIICPNVISYYEADYTEPWKYAWIGFVGEDAEAILHQSGLSVENPVFDFDLQGEVGRLLSLCESKNRFKPAHDMVKKSILNALLIELVKEKWVDEHQATGYIKASEQFILQHYSERLTIKDISEFVGINRSYLYKLFQEYKGVSPQEYLIELRMKEAKKLLVHTDITIREISSLIGYSDQLIFSKTFKKREGVSPKSFRFQSSSME